MTQSAWTQSEDQVPVFWAGNTWQCTGNNSLKLEIPTTNTLWNNYWLHIVHCIVKGKNNIEFEQNLPHQYCSALHLHTDRQFEMLLAIGLDDVTFISASPPLCVSWQKKLYPPSHTPVTSWEDQRIKCYLGRRLHPAACANLDSGSAETSGAKGSMGTRVWHQAEFKLPAVNKS